MSTATTAHPEHRTAAILSIGDELALGQALDTNSRWLSQQLTDRGISVVEHVTVPDDLPRHVAALKRLAADTHLIISSGGLGPTADDLTRDALAQASNDTLTESPEALAQIQSFFIKRGRSMPPANRSQALFPSRGSWLRNDHGTAPGIAATISTSRDDGTHHCDVFCIPGPPREMQPMFLSLVAPALRPPAGRVIRTRVLPTVGIGESDLAGALGTLMNRDAVPLVGTTASNGIVSIRIRYEGPLSAPQADALLDATEADIRARAGRYIFANADTPIEAAVLDELRRQRKSLCVVESCTGGLLAATLTDIPGSSATFAGGWVTYTNERKSRDVAVPYSLFKESAGDHAPGAVSHQVAAAMARGGLATARTDFALAITGIAGPTGGSADKPVGTVWIALAHRGPRGIHTDTRRFSMMGDRTSIRLWSVRAALAILWSHLANSPDLQLLRQIERHQTP
jgi:nicotinamide-nucleotide amidase